MLGVTRKASSIALLCALSLFSAPCTTESSEDAELSTILPKDSSPSRAGLILVSREGDLHVLEGKRERQVTDSDYHWAGVLTHDGAIVVAQGSDDRGSSLVELRFDESEVTETTQITLNWEPSDRIPRHGYIATSPDTEHVVVRDIVIGLASGLQVELSPGSCCASWSPNGRLVAYLAPSERQKDARTSAFSWDLWLTDLEAEAVRRRVATGLMLWGDPFGRSGKSIAWWNKGMEILALSLDGVAVIERSVSDASLRAEVNNQLVSVDVTTGGVRYVARSEDLHERIARRTIGLEDEVVISAAATHLEHDKAAFLVMDYGRIYGIGVLNGDGQLEQFVTRDVPNGQQVRMGAPVWSPDGTRFAYFGWQWKPRWIAYIEVFDVRAGEIQRVWESEHYVKPGHWDWSPDGRWIWIVVETSHPDDLRITRDRSLLVSVDQPGYIVSIHGIVLDWCCVPK